MKIKLECHEANHICDKNQYKEAKFWERVKLTFHLIYCRACRKYTARNVKLTKTMKDPEVKQMPTDSKTALKERLQKELSGQS